jgi:hypothetical protein
MSVAYRRNLRNGDNDHETELIQTNDTYADLFDDFFDARSNEQQNVNYSQRFLVNF